MRADEQIRELRYGQDNATATRSDFRCGEDDRTANRFEIRYGEDATTSRSHLRCGKDDDKLSCLLCFVIMFSDVSIRDFTDDVSSCLLESLSLTSFYQFVKVSFKSVESGTSSLNFV
ncbi:hypothetical protein HID58_004624 [Brassica napus]|uniref:Uncharacterized protein n=1 Tax=Brassica napus TaxID=3708 RepID=A0ABQ8E8L2_BRANA|nr:hypothetical protein HID58_004624 [Brassica napus]